MKTECPYGFVFGRDWWMEAVCEFQPCEIADKCEKECFNVWMTEGDDDNV